MRQQMEVITEMLEAARAIAQQSLQEQESMKAELADALKQLSSAEQVRLGKSAVMDQQFEAKANQSFGKVLVNILNLLLAA